MSLRPIELHMWPTPNSFKVTIFLEEAGLPYDIKLVNIGKGDQPARAIALLVPAEKFRHVAAFYRWIGSDEKGHFEMKGVRPGDYKLFAVEEIDPRTVQDPEFLKPIEASGVAVTLREGTNEKQKLTVIR